MIASIVREPGNRGAFPESAIVPGVYYAPQPRQPESPFARTDVAGFVGFDPLPDGTATDETRSRPIRCDDWRDYVLQVSRVGEPVDDGMLLSHAVRTFFMNGGRRCYVTLVKRPNVALAEEEYQLDVERARHDLLGIAGASETEATGLERLLMIEEVAIIDVPDLYAFRPSLEPKTVTLGGSELEADFLDCLRVRGQVGVIHAQRPAPETNPWFHQDQVFDVQREMIARCLSERWRVLLLLSIPWHVDSETSPSPVDAANWRTRFVDLVQSGGFAEKEEMSCAALVYPWVRAQDRVGAPVRELPPGSFAAGVIARRDLARGPHIAPANEVLRGVVQLAWPVDDDVQAMLYPKNPLEINSASSESGLSINVLRAFPGFGIQVWGARTLSTDKYLRYISVRRCLSAIQRRVKFSLDALVFEPNTPILWLQITQIVFSELQSVFETGALRGERIEQAFYVRCDQTTNSSDDVQSGRVLCEVGVAIAAPAEFIVFRLGRREGVVEVVE